jgi:hypothetical protein
VLATIGGSAAGIASVFHRSSGDRSADPVSASAEGLRTAGLESDLHDAVQQTERAAESLWQDLGGMALDSCSTGDQVVSLARRYTSTLPAASEMFVADMARSSAIAHSCAQYPGFGQKARERFAALATHLDRMSAMWQERRWLFERSKNNALDYLVRVDHP